MAKFKVGDKVTDGNSIFKITKVNPDDYEWKIIKGDGNDIHGKSIGAGGMISWADRTMSKVFNSAPLSTNPVVQNALAVTARNDSLNRGGYSHKKAQEFKNMISAEVSSFKSKLKNIKAKAASEFAKAKKVDPSGAFWLDEIGYSWIDPILEAGVLQI